MTADPLCAIRPGGDSGEQHFTEMVLEEARVAIIEIVLQSYTFGKFSGDSQGMSTY